MLRAGSSSRDARRGASRPKRVSKASASQTPSSWPARARSSPPFVPWTIQARSRSSSTSTAAGEASPIWRRHSSRPCSNGEAKSQEPTGRASASLSLNLLIDRAYLSRFARERQIPRNVDRRSIMKLQALGLGLLLALAGSGCTALNGGKTPSPLPGRYSATPPIDTKAAYPPSRLIGIKNNADVPCPEIPGWKVRQLFQLGVRRSSCGRGDSKGIEAVAKELDRFCIWEGGKGSIPRAATLGLADLEPDAVAMLPTVQVPGPS